MAAMTLPALRALHEDLLRLAEAGHLKPARSRDGRPVGEGRDVSLVRWPGAGEFWLCGPQRAVVRLLIEAYLNSRTPEVSQNALLLAAGRTGRLADLFKGSDAWGRLVLPGRAAGHFRLPDIPEGPDDAGPELTREPLD